MHSIQHVNKIFGGKIPGCARGIGTAAETGHRTVHHADALFQRREDICEGLAISVVEMHREPADRHLREHGIKHRLHA